MSNEKKKLPKVSVVFPTFNEGEFIDKNVEKAKGAKYVHEVIVIDGGSTDDTVEKAMKAGAKVLYQSREDYPGKGIAMSNAIDFATGDVIIFMDADIINLRPEMIELLIEPIIKNEADFVKGAFARAAGRVTELVAKPLLEIFFPEYSHFSQPLSGEIAGRKEVFKAVEFEEGWGVDVGLLIDIGEKGFRMKEVNVGFKDHDMKRLPELKDMAQEVAWAIIKRAIKKGRVKEKDKEMLV